MLENSWKKLLKDTLIKKKDTLLFELGANLNLKKILVIFSLIYKVLVMS